MISAIENLNFIMAIGGTVLLLASAVLFFDLYTNKTLRPYVLRFGLTVAFITAAVCAAMTLVYSEVFGFIPCGLCWFQRILLYPQVLILGTAVYLKERTAVLVYGIVLSVPGLIIALYQHYIQMGGTELVGCPSAGGDCSQRLLFEFGFMTFPLLSASSFLFLIALYFYIRKTA